MNRKLVLLAFVLFFVVTALVSQIASSQSFANKQCLIPQSGKVYYPNNSLNSTLNETVHNLDTGLNYTTIQEAINANRTLDGHTILVDPGTYYENVVVNKSISLFGQDRSTTIIDGNGTGTVVNITKNNVNITDFTIQNSKALAEDAGICLNDITHCNIAGNNIEDNIYGIHLMYSSNNNISGNSIADNGYGIYFEYSSNNNIFGNNMTNNFEGIMLENYSNNNSIVGNNVRDRIVGIWLVNSSYNNVVGNNVTRNQNGIYLYDRSNQNSIVGNNVTNNSFGIWVVKSSNQNSIVGNNVTNNYYGIYLYDSSYNNVRGNNVTGSNYLGIGLGGSSNNRLYHNNFIDNTIQVALDVDSLNNAWDNSVEGNYWSNYTGVDSDHDGIGDTPHVINVYNNDIHPLMGTFNRFNTSLGKHVNVISNSTIESFEYFEFNSTIKMYVSNMTGNQTYGFCRVCIPHALMDENNISVEIDDGATTPLYPDFNVYDNTTHRWIYFAYEHSIRKIDIIPEFPSLIITPLFIVATLLAVIVCKRKQPF